MLSQIAFRQGPSAFLDGKTTSTPARTVELELWIGASDFAARNRYYAQNFRGSPVLVIARKQVSMPMFVHPPIGGYPTPFSVVLKFDVPWSYSGTEDLCWEIRVHLNSNTGSSSFDGAWTRDYELSRGERSGTGCVATGRSAPMTLDGELLAYESLAKFALSLRAANAPSFARSTFLFGLSDPDRFWPSLCTMQHVDQVFHGVHLFADANGSFQTGMEVGYDAGLVGVRFYMQAYSLDPRHPMLVPVSATNGLRNTFPAAPPRAVDLAMVQGSISLNFGQLVPDLGLITEFR